MIIRRNVMLSLFLPLLLAGCSSGSLYNTAITNLTPGRAARSPEGLYLVEAHWRSNQQAIRADTFKAYVKMGADFYPMRRTQVLDDRWEAWIPVSAEERYVNYQFKFDYQVNAVPAPRPDSKLSATYQLEILDP
jgi:hypothetical protein